MFSFYFAWVVQYAVSLGLMRANTPNIILHISLIKNDALNMSRRSLNDSLIDAAREAIDERLLWIAFPEQMTRIKNAPPTSPVVDPSCLMSPTWDYSSLETDSNFSISGCEMEGQSPKGPVVTTPRRLGARDRRFYYRDNPRTAMPRRLDFGAVEESDEGTNISQTAGTCPYTDVYTMLLFFSIWQRFV